MGLALQVLRTWTENYFLGKNMKEHYKTQNNKLYNMHGEGKISEEELLEQTNKNTKQQTNHLIIGKILPNIATATGIITMITGNYAEGAIIIGGSEAIRNTYTTKTYYDKLEAAAKENEYITRNINEETIDEISRKIRK